jgi:hypothetical protein
VEDGKLKIRCTYCQRAIIANERKGGISGFKKHLMTDMHRRNSQGYQTDSQSGPFAMPFHPGQPTRAQPATCGVPFIQSNYNTGMYYT